MLSEIESDETSDKLLIVVSRRVGVGLVSCQSGLAILINSWFLVRSEISYNNRVCRQLTNSTQLGGFLCLAYAN